MIKRTDRFDMDEVIAWLRDEQLIDLQPTDRLIYKPSRRSDEPSDVEYHIDVDEDDYLMHLILLDENERPVKLV